MSSQVGKINTIQHFHNISIITLNFQVSNLEVHKISNSKIVAGVS